MKKRLAASLAALLLLCGCQAAAECTEPAAYYEELVKAQEIAVIPAGETAAASALASQAEITDFITALDMDHWRWQSLPETAEEAGTFSFSQEATLHLGETERNLQLQELCQLLCYRDAPYVTLHVLGFDLTFEVPDEAADYLNNYF